MADDRGHEGGVEHGSAMAPAVLNVLELLDNIAHVMVAIFFIVLAASVLVYSSLMLIRDIPLIIQPPVSASARASAEPKSLNPSTETDPAGHAAAGHDQALTSPARGASSEASGSKEPAGAHASGEGARSARPFLSSSLELLSSLLFAVIVLELLKTIITYLKTHNIQAIMKEFLVVGIISSIRKILLIGAESSLGSSDPTAAYVKEATGTVITIGGILLLIAGLILLQLSENHKWSRENESAPGV